MASMIEEKIQNLHPVLAGILRERGCRTEEDIMEFLSDRPKRTHDPFLMKGMSEAADLVSQYIREGKKICIYGDYDADGITSVSLLYEFLSDLTEQLMYYIPSRFSEGYGLNNGAADRIFDEGAELIITVDCGCVSAAEVDHIKELGMEVIVTDHHNVDSRKPDCILLDPKQEGDDYPCSWLCGCGVAFKLAQALQRRMGLPKSSVNRLLDLACVATIGDIVPLTGENRTLVKYGFDRIARGEREGLKRLIEGIGLDRYHLSSMNVAFGIVPHLNAAGRMKDASIGVRLLTGREEDQLNDLVEELKSLNSERKSIQERIFREACDEIRGCMQEDLFPVYDAKDAHEGVTGIVAGKLKETFYRPVIIVTDTEEPGYVKGTGRSVEGLDLHGILSGCADLFVKFGGHAGACGFTMKREYLEKLRSFLNRSMRDCLEKNPSLLTKEMAWDAQISSADVTLKFASQIALMEPFGEGNPEPVFLIPDVLIRRIFRMGKEGQYRKFVCEGNDGTIFDAVWFDVDEESERHIKEGHTVSMTAALGINSWRGKKSVQCLIRDILKK